MNMRSHMVRGAAWMVLLRWIVRLVGLASTLILARLLTPEDFGVFAIGLIVLLFLEFLAEGGVEFALVRETKADKTHYDSAWTVQILLSLGTGVVVFLSAPVVAYIFSEPRAEAVVQILALRPVIVGFNNIGVVTFLKEFEFHKSFQFEVARRMSDAIVTIALAVILRNYWSLVIGYVAGAAMSMAFSYWFHPYRPRLSFERIKQIWSFSGWLLASYAAEVFSDLIDRAIVGAIAVTKVLGIYHMAGTVGAVVMQSTIFPLWRGLFPSYAKLADDKEDLADAFFEVFGWVMVVCCIAGFGIAAVADDLVTVLLGEKWLLAIPLIPYLTLSVAINGIVDNPLLVLTALGRTKLCAISAMIRLVLLGIALPIGGYYAGAQGVAITVLIVAVIHAPVTFVMLVRTMPITYGAIVARAWRPLVSGLLMFAAVLLTSRSIDLHPALALCVEIAVGGAVYIGCTMLLWLSSGRPAGPEAVLIDFIAKRLPGRRTA